MCYASLALPLGVEGEYTPSSNTFEAHVIQFRSQEFKGTFSVWSTGVVEWEIYRNSTNALVGSGNECLRSLPELATHLQIIFDRYDL